jgi:opacity protein-like surface antigen
MRSLICLGSMVVVSLGVSAQPAATVEIGGGYQYLRFNPADSVDGLNMHGWNTGVQFNPSETLGLVAEFTGTFTNETGVDPGLYTFLFGPRYRFQTANSGLKPFLHALFGAGRLTVQGSFADNSETAFTMALGGGLDYQLSQRLALRVVQLDYLHTRFDPDGQNNLRFAAGIVVRFGYR